MQELEKMSNIKVVEEEQTLGKVKFLNVDVGILSYGLWKLSLFPHLHWELKGSRN